MAAYNVVHSKHLNTTNISTCHVLLCIIQKKVQMIAELSMDWIGLGLMTVMYKIMTAYVFQRNSPRLFYVIISDFLHTYCIVVPITSHRHVTLLFYFSLLTNIDYEQSSTMSWLDLAINMQH